MTAPYMNDTERIERVIKIVTNDEALRPFLCAEPQVLLIPLAKEHEKRFLFVSISIIEDALQLTVLASLSNRLALIVEDSKAIDDIDGLELLFSGFRNNVSRRVLRLSVQKYAIDIAKRLSPEGLKYTYPADGISCIFYEDIL